MLHVLAMAIPVNVAKLHETDSKPNPNLNAVVHVVNLLLYYSITST